MVSLPDEDLLFVKRQLREVYIAIRNIAGMKGKGLLSIFYSVRIRCQKYIYIKKKASCIKQRMYFLTRHIIKLHNLQPQDSTGTENMNSVPGDRRKQHSIHALFLLLSEQ